jgi:eukaryotic-like serine/threonine-protein kinase
MLSLASKASSSPITILFLAASPADMVPLKLDEEVRAIDLALCQSEFGRFFHLEQHWAVRATEIQALLLRYQPDIVHFSGHGSTNSELMFLDDNGQHYLVNAETFSRLFSILRDNIRCVVLNACYSSVQAEAIAQYVDVVVGVSQAIGDRSAIQFAAAFYQALGFGRSVKSAFDLGVAQIELANLDYSHTLQLIALHQDPDQLVFAPQYLKPTPVHPSSRRTDRNRTTLIKLVNDFWIEGVLKKSLYHEVLLRLALHMEPEAVDTPLWEMVVRRPKVDDQPLPPDTSIDQVFEDLHRSLLILGEPGAGKTTTLLNLARAALEWSADGTEPIPVVFNLASWTEQRFPIEDWLLAELKDKYQIPVKIAQPWIANDELLLLLDGLDQVGMPHRVACVAALNAFLEKHLVEIAICCRVNDYSAIDQHLHVRGTVVLQALSGQQIQQFLASAGLEQSPLATDIQDSLPLQQLAQSPLMLNVMALAYSRMPDPPTRNSTHAADHLYIHLFNCYVARMLAQRPHGSHYTPPQTRSWLAWLAKLLVRQGQVEFLIESLRPACLSRRGDRLLYDLALRAISGLLFILAGTAGGLAFRLAGNISLIKSLLTGLIVGTLFLLPFELSGLVARRLPRWAAIGITVGLTALVALPFPVGEDSKFRAIASLIISLTMALPASLAGSLLGHTDVILLADRLIWSWRKARYGLALALGTALAVGLTVTYFGYGSRSLSDAITAALVVGAVAIPVTGLTRSMTIPQTKLPNEGVWRSLHNALWVAIAVFVPVLLTGTVWGLVYQSSLGIGLGCGLIFGLPIALAAGLAEGGIAGLQHVILRVLLYRRGVMPWNYSRFLNDAADRCLLRKVGGSYIFMHALLLDYFAESPDGLYLRDRNFTND